MTNKLKSWVDKVPTIGWIILIPAALILVIGSIISSFWAMTTIEGISSLILILVALIFIKDFKPKYFMAGILCFYALMGAAVDQIGNPVLNYPVEWVFCEESQILQRDVSISNPLPGRTYIQQGFSCINEEGNTVRAIHDLEIFGMRFLEYLMIAYLIVLIKKLVNLSASTVVKAQDKNVL